MRFRQRLKVIQSLEDTAKRSVVGGPDDTSADDVTPAGGHTPDRCVCVFQVRAILTDSAFGIEELEELYCLFKVRTTALS